MSNKTYLCISQDASPHALFTDPRAGNSIVLCCDMCTPLLWLPLFTPNELTIHSFSAQGQRFEGAVAVTNIATALQRLQEQSRRIGKAISPGWDLTPYAALLIDFLSSRDGDVLSLEPLELESIDPAHGGNLRAALAAAGGNPITDPSPMVTLSTVVPQRPLPHPDKLIGLSSAEEADLVNMMRILGYGNYQSVPWDPW